MRASKITKFLATTAILALGEKWSGSGVLCSCKKRVDNSKIRCRKSRRGIRSVSLRKLDG